MGVGGDSGAVLAIGSHHGHVHVTTSGGVVRELLCGSPRRIPSCGIFVGQLLYQHKWLLCTGASKSLTLKKKA